MNRFIPKLAGRILPWSSALVLLTVPASAQSPQSTKPAAVKSGLDHHCAVPDGMVGEWLLDDMIVVRNGMPGPRISRTYGVQLSIACDGAYVEDATGARLVAGPDMPPIPTGHSPEECTYSAGGSSGMMVAEHPGHRFRPPSAAHVVQDEVGCVGGVHGRFGTHLHMGRNPWTHELNVNQDVLELIQTMQSNEGDEIVFRLIYNRQT